MVLINRLICFD